jgi:hypothetical protein
MLLIREERSTMILGTNYTKYSCTNVRIPFRDTELGRGESRAAHVCNILSASLKNRFSQFENLSAERCKCQVQARCNKKYAIL